MLHDLADPLLHSTAIAAVGLIGLAWRRWRSGAVLIVAAIGWAWLCSTPAFSGWMQHGLASRYPPHPAASYASADAIVIVEGGTLPTPVHHWNADQDPALTTPLGFGLALFRAGKAPWIVLSGERGAARLMADMLLRQGVPANALKLAPDSLSTYQDALYTFPLLRDDHAKRVLVVTFPLHMLRTAATFKRQGIAIIAAPSFPPVSNATPARKSLRPSWAALRRSVSCLHEYLGLFYYRLRGWAVW